MAGVWRIQNSFDEHQSLKFFLSSETEFEKNMHGRPRKAPKPEDEAASSAKAQKLRALQSQFLSHHQNRTSVPIFFPIPAIQTSSFLSLFRSYFLCLC